MKTPPYWASDEHALMAGMLLGHLLAHRVVASFATDADGNYMNEIIINMEPGLDSLRVKIEVLPY
jgi:hypothetical protein